MAPVKRRASGKRLRLGWAGESAIHHCLWHAFTTENQIISLLLGRVEVRPFPQTHVHGSLDGGLCVSEADSTVDGACSSHSSTGA
ncbi:hypothetical protein CUR178_04013 [Leishmania enriettii]|uniref:Uncharacterized protein n=1 Tax=Leishmania enriettii TaxID=5663 RepID=A0A836KKZ3_LEIEN|nr:hypothetical protein CUR178_04013 [Leishmania enriettii]